MLDLLGQEIVEGSIIAYAARIGSSQVIRFAVVYEEESLHGTKWRIMVRPVEFVDPKSGTYRLRSGSNGHTETVHIRENQVYVVNKDTLPKSMIKALEDAYCLYLKKKTEGRRLQDQGYYKKAKKLYWEKKMESMNNGDVEMIKKIREDIFHINHF